MSAFTERQRAFLDQPLNAIVATLRQDGTPSQSIVWYARDGDALWISVRPDSVKARHLANDARLSILILSAAGDRYLRIEGAGALDGEVDDAARRTLIGRYVGADKAADLDGRPPIAQSQRPDQDHADPRRGTQHRVIHDEGSPQRRRERRGGGKEDVNRRHGDTERDGRRDEERLVNGQRIGS